jgi:hypothetical protein
MEIQSSLSVQEAQLLIRTDSDEVRFAILFEFIWSEGLFHFILQFDLFSAFSVRWFS